MMTEEQDLASSRDGTGVPVHFLTEEEGRELFDEAARYWLNMSGEEFLRAWDAGEFADNPDRPGVITVSMMLPLVR